MLFTRLTRSNGLMDSMGQIAKSSRRIESITPANMVDTGGDRSPNQTAIAGASLPPAFGMQTLRHLRERHVMAKMPG